MVESVEENTPCALERGARIGLDAVLPRVPLAFAERTKPTAALSGMRNGMKTSDRIYERFKKEIKHLLAVDNSRLSAQKTERKTRFGRTRATCVASVSVGRSSCAEHWNYALGAAVGSRAETSGGIERHLCLRIRVSVGCVAPNNEGLG